MKTTFTKLPKEKKERIVNACIDEFGSRGYEGSSTDRIIRHAGISKGGLYEYISSKEDLFLYTVEYTYKNLYGYLNSRIHSEGITLPGDILDRLRLVAELAIDFYIYHPRYVYLIVRTYKIHDKSLDLQVKKIFREQFLDLFGNTDLSGVQPEKEKLMDLITWLLLKTRYDFLLGLDSAGNPGEIKKQYLDNWSFYLAVLKNGIYK